ncbi:MAG: type II secretion system protein [Ruminococcus sp.]|nr:type II secretion system protein [Ruminococcus sp.]
MTNTKKNGFTLIELIVVIAIIGVLAAILVPTMIGYVKKSKRAADVSSAKDIHTQVMDLILTEDYLNDSFYYDGGNVSSAISKLDEISNHTYDLVVVAYLDGAGKTDGSGNVWTPTDAGIQDFCDALNKKSEFYSTNPDIKRKIKSKSDINGKNFNRWYVGYRKDNASTVEVWIGDGSTTTADPLKCLYAQVTRSN